MSSQKMQPSKLKQSLCLLNITQDLAGHTSLPALSNGSCVSSIEFDLFGKTVVDPDAANVIPALEWYQPAVLDALQLYAHATVNGVKAAASCAMIGSQVNENLLESTSMKTENYAS